MERAPYGRQRQSKDLVQPYRGETYYDLPPLKPSHYGQLIAGYLFVGGIAGASQTLATVIDFHGAPQDRSLSRSGRYVALAGAVISPVLLIADLQKPTRWYNMLRIFRRTSPMSIGSWTLAGFGGLSTLAALAQYFGDKGHSPKFARAAIYIGVPAALLGSSLSTYTGTLLAATSTPLWAHADELLPALFGASSMATACAAVSLATPEKSLSAGKKLDSLALFALGLETLLTIALEGRLKRYRLAVPLLEEKPVALMYRYGYKGLGVMIPLGIHALSLLSGRRAKLWSITAAVATLAGGYLLRTAIVSAGNSSAKRADDHLRTTQVKPRANLRLADKQISIADQCRAATEKIERAMAKHGREFIREMDEVERMIVQLRDTLIDRLRRDEADGPNHAALERINNALSMIIGLEYPIAGIRRDTLEQVRNTLAGIAAEIQLQEGPAPDLSVRSIGSNKGN